MSDWVKKILIGGLGATIPIAVFGGIAWYVLTNVQGQRIAQIEMTLREMQSEIRSQSRDIINLSNAVASLRTAVTSQHGDLNLAFMPELLSTPPDSLVFASQFDGLQEAQIRTESDIEAAKLRAAAAEERMMRSALATRVFYFNFDVSEFREEDRGTLTYHARDLAQNPSRRIRLEGHADERGTREYNLALGERRANGILNYLIVNGASRSQVEVVSYGPEQEVEIRGPSEAAYQRNRRVEIVDIN